MTTPIGIHQVIVDDLLLRAQQCGFIGNNATDAIDWVVRQLADKSELQRQNRILRNELAAEVEP